MTLAEYLLNNRERPVIDFHIRCDNVIDGKPTFYIHAANTDSDTLTFVVNGNHLIPMDEYLTVDRGASFDDWYKILAIVGERYGYDAEHFTPLESGEWFGFYKDGLTPEDAIQEDLEAAL